MGETLEETTYPLADFARDAATHAERIKRDKTPEALTVDGRVELVVQDAESYQSMLDQIEKAKFLDSLRSAMRDADMGRGLRATER